MRVLVTGATGFVGRHAVNELTRCGHSVIAAGGPDSGLPPKEAEASFEVDLSDAELLAAKIKEHQPDACLHLAGIAFVPVGWTNPQLVFRVNVNGTVNLLEGFRAHKPDARILSITSSLIYGNQPRGHALTEEEPPTPENIYALSKWTQDGSSLLYAKRYDMNVMTARPCNHIGPGQSSQFVVTSFSQQMIDIADGNREPKMKVGNLASERAFTDVRDTVRAYRLLLEKGTAGQAYNVASKNLIKIQTIFDKLCQITGIKPEVEIDSDRFRPTDAQPLLDCSKILAETGWKPELSLDQTLTDVVAYLRAQG